MRVDKWLPPGREPSEWIRRWCSEDHGGAQSQLIDQFAGDAVGTPVPGIALGLGVISSVNSGVLDTTGIVVVVGVLDTTGTFTLESHAARPMQSSSARKDAAITRFILSSSSFDGRHLLLQKETDAFLRKGCPFL